MHILPPSFPRRVMTAVGFSLSLVCALMDESQRQRLAGAGAGSAGVALVSIVTGQHQGKASVQNNCLVKILAP